MNDAQADLDAWLDEDDGATAPDLDAPPEQIDPDDADAAERRLRRLRRLAREKAEVQDVAAAEIGRITRWKEDRVAAIERAEAWIAASLEAWHRGRTGARRVGKSLTLPSGTLRLRAPGAQALGIAEGTTAAAVIERLRVERPEWVRTTHTLDRAQIKADTAPGPDGTSVVDKRTGAVVDGLAYVPKGEDTFSLEVRP